MNHYESDHQPVYLCSSSISTCSSLSSYLKDHVHDACKSDMIYYIIANTPERYAFFRLGTISIRYLAFLFDTIQYQYNIFTSKKTFFLRNFRQFFRIFCKFLEFSAYFRNFLNFRNVQRIFGEKDQINHWF